MRKLEVLVPIFVSVLIIAGGSVPLIAGNVTDIGTYLATFAAVVLSWITLYYSVLRQLLRKPVIKLEPNAGTITLEPKEGLKTYLRLKVMNIGQTVAKNCVGKILEIRDEDKNIIPYDPLHFFWARQNDEDVGFHPVNIYPGDSEFLDIARIGHKDQNFKFRVSTLGQQLPSGKYLPMKSYYFKIAIYADDMEPFQAWYQVKLNKGSLKDSYLEKVKEPSIGASIMVKAKTKKDQPITVPNWFLTILIWVASFVMLYLMLPSILNSIVDIVQDWRKLVSSEKLTQLALIIQMVGTALPIPALLKKETHKKLENFLKRFSSQGDRDMLYFKDLFSISIEDIKTLNGNFGAINFVSRLFIFVLAIYGLFISWANFDWQKALQSPREHSVVIFITPYLFIWAIMTINYIVSIFQNKTIGNLYANSYFGWSLPIILVSFLFYIPVAIIILILANARKNLRQFSFESILGWVTFPFVFGGTALEWVATLLTKST